MEFAHARELINDRLYNEAFNELKSSIEAAEKSHTHNTEAIYWLGYLYENLLLSVEPVISLKEACQYYTYLYTLGDPRGENALLRVKAKLDRFRR